MWEAQGTCALGRSAAQQHIATLTKFDASAVTCAASHAGLPKPGSPAASRAGATSKSSGATLEFDGYAYELDECGLWFPVAGTDGIASTIAFCAMAVTADANDNWDCNSAAAAATTAATRAIHTGLAYVAGLPDRVRSTAR